MSHAIPSDWHDVVRRVSGWLDDATQQLDRHEADFVTKFSDAPATLPSANEELSARLAQLPAKIEPIDAQVQAVDTVAAEAEGTLRDLARRSETLRLRLAEWVGRAIG